jgi:hypothetical protein
MSRPTVVFLHGLGRTHRSLERLRQHVARAGFPTWARTYPSREAPIAELTEAVGGWLREELPDQPLCAVTHSLGGVLVRHLAAAGVEFQRVVMLAPPNGGSTVAWKLRDFGPFRSLWGPAGQDVAHRWQEWPPLPPQTAVIAGTRGPSVGNPPSWLVGTLGLIPRSDASDGTVTVAEARHGAHADFATVKASHSWIMDHPDVKAMVLRYLESGRLK